MKYMDESNWTPKTAPTDKVLGELAHNVTSLDAVQSWPLGRDTLSDLRAPWIRHYTSPPTTDHPAQHSVLLDVDGIPADLLPAEWVPLRGTGAGVYASLTGYGPPHIEADYAAYAARLAEVSARLTEQRLDSGQPLHHPDPTVALLAAADRGPVDELRVYVHGGYRPVVLDLIGLSATVPDLEDGDRLTVSVERMSQEHTDDDRPRYVTAGVAHYRVDRSSGKHAERWVGSELPRSGRYVGVRIETLYLAPDLEV